MQSVSATPADIYTNVLTNTVSLETIGDLTNQFFVLKKCNGKLDCLIYEMLFIKKKRPCLNTQSGSIRAKLFDI